MISPDDVRAAAERTAGSVRRTPLVRADQLTASPVAAELWLKLECLQVTGSFKARGAMNRLLTTSEDALRRGIVTASGGNHGLAVRAGRVAGVHTTVFVPDTVSPAKLAKLNIWANDVRVAGGVWDEADEVARQFSEVQSALYFHPFADSAIVAGQGTVALEVLEDLADVDLFLIAAGGGGLIAGMSTAIRAIRPSARIVGIAPVGSPTLRASLDAGQVVQLPSISTRVATMACRRTDPGVFELVRRTIDDIVLVEDDDMVDAARWLWFELGVAADLSGAAAVAALRRGMVGAGSGERVCALVCGAGMDGADAGP